MPLPAPPSIDVERLLREPEVVIAEMVYVDLMDLEGVMAHQASLFGHIVGLCTKAKALAAASKFDLEFVASQVFREQPVGTSVARADRLVKEHVRYQAQLSKLKKLDKAYDVYKGLLQAFEHRRDMIIQIAARQRQEISSLRSS